METVKNLSPEHKVVPSLCLDFDGTIRRSKSGQTFIQNFNDIELMPGIEEVIWTYRNMGYLILGISNQAGVAHGFKLPLEIEAEMTATFNLFKNNPFHIAKHCYHDGKGKIEPYCHRSLLRKPDIGMLALMEYEAYNNGYVIDWDKILFVGDRPEDAECALNAKIAFLNIADFLIINEALVHPKLPTTLDEAVEYYLPKFDGMDKFLEQSESDFASFCHSQLSGGIGMKIRNEMGFWTKDTELYSYMVNVQGLEHPYDMSDKIIRAIWKVKNTTTY